MRLRTWLILGATLMITGIIAAAIVFDDEEAAGFPVTLGPPSWTPPLLRYSLGGQDRVMVLVRRTETETLPASETRTPARGDRLEVRGYDAATLAPVFQAPVASVATNAASSAGLLGEHAATIWVFADSLGAVSAVDGQVLIERQGLLTLTPDLAATLFQPRISVWMATDGLRLQSPTGPLRLHPRTLRAQQLPATVEALPPPRMTAPFETRAPAPFRVTEARIGETWFGLPPANAPPTAGTRTAAIPGARFLPGGGQPAGTPQRLWRATIGTAPATPDIGFQTTRPAAPTPANTALRLDAPTPLPFETASLGQAGFLTLSPHPDSDVLRPPGAPGLLILHRASPTTLGLTRINAQGSPEWTTTLPITRLISALPGEGPLVLAGTDTGGTETLIAVALGTGATVTRILGQ